MQHIKGINRIAFMISFLLTSIIVNAQDKIKIDKGEIKTWFENYWMWLVGGLVIVFLLVAIFSRRAAGRLGSRRTTTVIKDEHGKTKSVVTTEEPVKLS
jgi:choline-glycine betaine transporter